MGREIIGARREIATVKQHNGNRDEMGQPTLNTATDWETVIDDWPCEGMNVQGGERLRGRQVAANTSHVFVGEYYGAEKIRPDMRLYIESDDNEYHITTAYDLDGDRRKMRVECKIESGL